MPSSPLRLPSGLHSLNATPPPVGVPAGLRDPTPGLGRLLSSLFRLVLCRGVYKRARISPRFPALTADEGLCRLHPPRGPAEWTVFFTESGWERRGSNTAALRGRREQAGCAVPARARGAPVRNGQVFYVIASKEKTATRRRAAFRTQSMLPRKRPRVDMRGFRRGKWTCPKLSRGRQPGLR